MKTFTFTSIIISFLAMSADAAPKRKHRSSTSSAAAVATAAPAAGTASTVAAGGAVAAAAAGGAITRGASTVVMFEVGGIPGNECLTFRNNGEMVDAACVNTAADRQVTPSTNAAGDSVLLVQRSFTAGFRPDLVGKDVCVGFNGTDFLAEDCAATGISFVSLVGGELKSGTACQSGHDGKAQLTVDTTGTQCVGVTLTTVTPTAP